MSISNYDTWKLHNGETKESMAQERLEEEIVERYQREFEIWLNDLFTVEEIDVLSDYGVLPL